MACKYIYLGQDWSTSDLNSYGLGSIYLAGPINNPNNSWRLEFIKKISGLGLNVTFLIPDSKDVPRLPKDDNQKDHFAWQKSAISAATAVVFWFPAGDLDPQSFVEFGAWCKSERIFLGGDGHEIEYLDWLLHTEQKINAANTLDQLAERVVHWIMG